MHGILSKVYMRVFMFTNHQGDDLPMTAMPKGNEENQPSIAGWRSNADTVITYS